MNNRLTEPNIQDYEILRKIGGGSYGEIWLARSVTGALRALKVVWREDFDDEKSFEREFEGVQKFEPLSRDHPGLVNLLHVGRSNSKDDFYYYVMELGDDIENGTNINPVDYEGRTLRSDVLSSAGKPQLIRDCIEVGISLADALDYLHNTGLSHRDVKPANVIFVNGKAKLADIGLVASTGQNTFVGTEGFVPPEGPGSSHADVYSLGKVLYELATGKDRLQFPEIPDEIHPDSTLKQWNALNQVICDTCEPQLGRRNILTAKDLSVALNDIKEGRTPKSNNKNTSRNILLVMLILLMGASIYLAKDLFNEEDSFVNQPEIPEIDFLDLNTSDGLTPESDLIDEEVNTTLAIDVQDGEVNSAKKYCIVNFNISPEREVEVFDIENKFMGYAEEVQLSGVYEIGQRVELILRKESFEDFHIDFTIPDQDVVHESYILKMDKPPIAGESWGDSLEQTYHPGKEFHDASWVEFSTWERYQELNYAENFRKTEVVELKYNKNRSKDVVLVTRKDANVFAEWLTERSQLEGRLKETQEIIALTSTRINAPKELLIFKHRELYPLKLRVQETPLAKLKLVVKPADSMLFIDGVFLGTTEKLVFDIQPGDHVVRVEKEGFDSYAKKVKFHSGAKVDLKKINLTKLGKLDPTKPWQNKLGMRFISLTDILMASVFETRVAEYKVFLKTRGEKLNKQQVNTDDNKPVVFVSLNDAKDFAKWLTLRDRKLLILPRNAEYAVPTDAEWSIMVGLEEESGLLIEAKALLNKNIYPWEGNWKADEDDKLSAIDESSVAIGNFSDETRRSKLDLERSYYDGYTDGYSGVSPVGIYPENKNGIYDLGGNVSEWVTDTVNNGELQVSRGSNYKTYVHRDLRSSYRDYKAVGTLDEDTGFRLVIRITPTE